MTSTALECASNATVIGAIRLAMISSDSDATRIRIIELLLDDAPRTDPKDTAGVRLFVEVIQALGAEVTLA